VKNILSNFGSTPKSAQKITNIRANSPPKTKKSTQINKNKLKKKYPKQQTKTKTKIMNII